MRGCYERGSVVRGYVENECKFDWFVLVLNRMGAVISEWVRDEGRISVKGENGRSY